MWAFYFFYHKWWLFAHWTFPVLFLLGEDRRSKCTICQHRILSIAIWIMSCTPLSFQRCLMLMQGVLQPSEPGTLSISPKGRIMASYKWVPQMPRFSDGLLPEPFWCLEHQVIRILMGVWGVFTVSPCSAHPGTSLPTVFAKANTGLHCIWFQYSIFTPFLSKAPWFLAFSHWSSSRLPTVRLEGTLRCVILPRAERQCISCEHKS